MRKRNRKWTPYQWKGVDVDPFMYKALKYYKRGAAMERGSREQRGIDDALNSIHHGMRWHGEKDSDDFGEM